MDIERLNEGRRHNAAWLKLYSRNTKWRDYLWTSFFNVIRKPLGTNTAVEAWTDSVTDLGMWPELRSRQKDWRRRWLWGRPPPGQTAAAEPGAPCGIGQVPDGTECDHSRLGPAASLLGNRKHHVSTKIYKTAFRLTESLLLINFAALLPFIFPSLVSYPEAKKK